MSKAEILKRLKEATELLEQDLAANDDPVQIGQVVAVHTFRSLQVLRDATVKIAGCYAYCTEAISQITGVTHILGRQEQGKGGAQ